jgi:hypothetical protein
MRALIANIDIAVSVAHKLGLESLPAPNRAGVLAEKLAAHVIVDSDDVQSLAGKEPRGLGPDQTRRSSDYRNCHPAHLLTLVSVVQLTIGQQSAIGGDHTAAEPKHQAAVEIQPRRTLSVSSAGSPWLPRSIWDKMPNIIRSNIIQNRSKCPQNHDSIRGMPVQSNPGL